MPSTQSIRVSLFSQSLLFATVIGCSHSMRDPGPMPGGRSADSLLIAPTESSVEESVPAGELDGVVVDAYTGSVLSHTTVSVIGSASSSRYIGVVSDESGRFRITGVGPGPATLVFRHLGYRVEQIPVSGDSGFIVRGGLHALVMTACGLLVITAPWPAITVIVRDVRTGAAPRVPVTLHVNDGRFADSSTVSASLTDLPDSLALGAAPDRIGRYRVLVTAPGYKAWQVREVQTHTSACYGMEGRYLPVWLLPTSGAAGR